LAEKTKEPQRPLLTDDDFVEIRSPGGRLLFRFDPSRDLIEIKRTGDELLLVDLRPFRRQAGVFEVHGKSV